MRPTVIPLAGLVRPARHHRLTRIIVGSLSGFWRIITGLFAHHRPA
jgi:hypothetical protein